MTTQPEPAYALPARSPVALQSDIHALLLCRLTLFVAQHWPPEIAIRDKMRMEFTMYYTKLADSLAYDLVFADYAGVAVVAHPLTNKLRIVAGQPAWQLFRTKTESFPWPRLPSVRFTAGDVLQRQRIQPELSPDGSLSVSRHLPPGAYDPVIFADYRHALESLEAQLDQHAYDFDVMRRLATLIDQETPP